MISFVVIAFNEERHIRSCLESITIQTGLEDYEIVVVDDGSTDGTAAVVRGVRDGNSAVRLIEQANLGRGAARATGVRAARGELIAMVDSDILLPPDWLTTCLSHIDQYDAVGGTAVPDGDVTYVFNTFRLLPVGAPATTTITGNNGLYRRAVFEGATFDERLREGEDVDINHKLRDSGFRLACIPGLQVEHRESKSLIRSLTWLCQSGRGATRQLFRYREVRQPDLAFAGVLAVAATSWLARSRYPRVARSLLPAYLLAASERHLHGRFVASGPARYRARYAAAVFVNALLIAAYFVGRTIGVVAFPLFSKRNSKPLLRRVK